jgi:hypothetical protein
MGVTKFPNGVSSYGAVMIPGMELGKVWGTPFYVDAATGSDDNDGKCPDNPKITIQAGLNLCTAGKGDRVFVKDGAYAEDLTMTKDDVMLVGESVSGVVVTGATDATDTLIITGDEVTVANMSLRAFDTGSDISLIKTTKEGTRIMYCDFAGGELQIENVGGHNALIIGCHFVTPDDVTDGACIHLEDANNCKVLYCGFFVDANSDAIIHHDADNLEVGWCIAVGDDDTGASAGYFVFIVGADGTSELMVHDCNVTLFGGVIGEDGALVAAHGLGTADLANTVNTHGNDGEGCTVYFDTTDA